MTPSSATSHLRALRSLPLMPRPFTSHLYWHMERALRSLPLVDRRENP